MASKCGVVDYDGWLGIPSFSLSAKQCKLREALVDSDCEFWVSKVKVQVAMSISKSYIFWESSNYG